MKHLLAVLTTIVGLTVLTVTAPALAQHGQHHPEGRPGTMMGRADTTGGMMDMMGTGMMGGMEGMPMMRGGGMGSQGDRPMRRYQPGN